jgi:Rieske 2Fe-2S family protein
VKAIQDLTDRFGADVVIDAVGRPETWKQAFYARDLAGTVVLVGVPTPAMTLQMPLVDIFSRGGALKSPNRRTSVPFMRGAAMPASVQSLPARTPPSSTVDDRVRDLVANRTPGRSLDAAFYTDREVFDLDMAVVFATSWIFAATEAEIPDAGDYVTVDFGPHSVIVIRDDEEKIGAFHNVCRHRGARLLVDREGSVGNIVCAYHQWTYGTDGSLRFAESPPPGFDPSCFGLRSVHARSVAGLIFICLAQETPPDFDEVAGIIESYALAHNLSKAKVAQQIDLIENGNWKLTMENNRECYHCTGHPELGANIFPVYGYSPECLPPRLQPAAERLRLATEEALKLYDSLGLKYQAREELDNRPTGFRIEREPLDLAGESFTPDGKAAVKRLLADFPTAKLGRLGLHTQPNAWFHILSDHAVTFSALPLSPDKTLVRTTWLVHADAVEGVDYDLEILTHVWRRTNLQDANFVELAQRGVSNPGYVPGPYSPTEYQVEAFVNWYIKALRTHLGEPTK